ncbi:hypothetical protein Droror1_Dr00023581 [Drosera rotundifolia]
MSTHHPCPPPPPPSSPLIPLNRESQDSMSTQLCRTPTSEEYRIPAMRSPPSAPRKKRRCVGVMATVMSGKRGRRLSPVVVVDEKEIDEFFRCCCDQIKVLKRCRLQF